MDTIDSVLDALGGVTKVSTYLSVWLGEPVPVGTVSAWKTRGSVGDRYRPGLVLMARERRVAGVTFESLTLMHANKARVAGETARATP